MDLKLAIAVAPLGALIALWVVHVRWRAYSTRKVMSEGVVTEAEVVGSRWWGKGTMVKFKYYPGERVAPLVSRRLIEDTYISLKPGDRMRLKYLPKWPRMCVLIEHPGTHDAL